MKTLETSIKPSELRGQASNAKLGIDLAGIARATAKLWRKYHLDYDATKHVVERVRREFDRTTVNSSDSGRCQTTRFATASRANSVRSSG